MRETMQAEAIAKGVGRFAMNEKGEEIFIYFNATNK
jgi:hypothetical protein